MSQLARKLHALTAASRFDVCVPGECMQLLESSTCITYNRNMQGCGRMLKVLMHGSCSYDCAYCAIRLDRNRMSFTPKELAAAFLRLYWQGSAGGLFLSSGIPHNVDLVMADLIETARLLRSAGYDGYLHLKILPGAQRTDIREAARLASRISINIEVPTAGRMRALSGIKDYATDILKRQDWVAEAKPDSHTTQLVVGASGETDREILDCVLDRYHSVQPSRIYYSGFRALPGTRLSGKENTPQWRTNRWHQLDALIREYGLGETGFSGLFTGDGVLMNEDPKAVLARGMTPLDPNTASREDLIRVPGIGPDRADAIVKARELHPIRSYSDLRSIGIPVRRILPYLTVQGSPGRQSTLAGF